MWQSASIIVIQIHLVLIVLLLPKFFHSGVHPKSVYEEDHLLLVHIELLLAQIIDILGFSLQALLNKFADLAT